MSWLAKLFRPPAAIPTPTIVGAIERIAQRVQDIQEYRKALAKAAMAGDLDGPLETWIAANARARDFIKHG